MKFQKKSVLIASALLICCLQMQDLQASSNDKKDVSPASSYGDFASLAEDYDASQKNNKQSGSSFQKNDDSERFVSMMSFSDNSPSFYEFVASFFTRRPKNNAVAHLVNLKNNVENQKVSWFDASEGVTERPKSLLVYMSSRDGLFINGLQRKQPKAVKSQEQYYPTDFVDALNQFQNLDEEN